MEERARSEQEAVRGDVQRQAELARAAHQKYETELMLHAEDVKALTAAKELLATTEAQVRELQKSVETAQANLATSQTSWTEQRTALETEKEDLAKRIKDLNEQNSVLHNSLESLTSQASAIQSRAEQSTDGDTSLSASPVEELREVIKYLRREKEIAELQMDLNKQESARFRQALEHSNQSLAEIQRQLSEERVKNASSSESSAQHAELLDKINQLSILRESNATLREETERATRRARELEASLLTANAQIDPLREQVRSTQVQLESVQAQLKLVQEDNKRWQARAQSILQQYNQVDPEEIKRLEERAATAETARAAAEAKLAELEQGTASTLEQEKARAAQELKEAKSSAEERFNKLRQQTIERLRGHTDTTNQLRTEIETLKAAGETSEQTVAQLTEEIEKVKAAAAATAATGAAGDTEAEKKWEEEKQQLVAARTQAEEAKAKAEAAKAEADTAKAQAEEREARHLAKARESTQAKVSWRCSGIEREARADNPRFLCAKNTAMAAKLAAEQEMDKLKKEQAEAIEKAVSERLSGLGAAEGASESDAAAISTLQARIGELETELKAARGQMETALGTATSDFETKLKAQEAELADKFAKQQAAAIEDAVKKTAEAAKADAAGAGAAPSVEQIEAEVQKRLSETEKERDAERKAAIQSGIQSAIEAKEKDLAAAHEAALKAQYEAGKGEATLRHTLMTKKKDNQIAALQAQLAELKGESTAAATEAGATTGAGAPANAPKQSTRGGGAPRARGRGAAAAGGGAAGKRKASEDAGNDVGENSGAANTKKPRGGGAIAIQRPTIKRPG